MCKCSVDVHCTLNEHCTCSYDVPILGQKNCFSAATELKCDVDRYIL